MLCGEERGQVHDASVLFMSCHCHVVSRRGKRDAHSDVPLRTYRMCL